MANTHIVRENSSQVPDHQTTRGSASYVITYEVHIYRKALTLSLV